MRRAAVGICFLAMALVLLIFILDFTNLNEFQSRFERRFTQTEASTPFVADLQISILSYDAANQSLSVRSDLSVFAVEPIRNLAFSLREEPDGRRRRWEHYNADGDGVTTFETFENDRQVSEFKVSDVQPLSLAVIRPPLFYPFDAYQTQICTRCCANNDGGPCLVKSYAHLRKLELDFGPLSLAPGFRAAILEDSSPGTFLVNLKRQPFIRIVSIVLLVLSVCFLAYLLSCQEGEDLMKGALGYFGALWALRSLIVPDSMEHFPTIVDYAIITLFCTLFLGVLAKTILRGGKHAIQIPPADPAPVSFPAALGREGPDIPPAGDKLGPGSTAERRS